MAQLDGRQGNDKKRHGGNFRPQGKKGTKKKTKAARTGHVNKYASAPRGPKPKKQRFGITAERR